MPRGGLAGRPMQRQFRLKKGLQIMPRLIKRVHDQPYSVTIGGEIKNICGCGLSSVQPFCDGSHKISESEETDKLYWYDDTGKRHLIAEDNCTRMRADMYPEEIQRALAP
jgi:CDGSH-type Zn-finger protein